MPATKDQCRAYRQRLKERVAKLFAPFSCRDCGSLLFVELAHLEPTGLKGASRGLDRRYLDAIKNPDKYKPLCKQCHHAFDNPPKAEEDW